MRGFIIYSREDAERNISYISWYIDKFKLLNVDLVLVYTDEIDYNDLPDFAIVRSIRPDITEKLEKHGVKCFNNSHVSKICNDKYITYKYVSENGIEIMPVYESIDGIKKYPVVIKPKGSHGGDRVNMAESRDELLGLLPLYAEKDYVIQAAAPDLGKDLRVYVIGNKIITAMLRQSENDFRSNFCLGGTAEVYTLNAEEIKKVESIIKLFDFDFVGIDFIFNNGELVFNEIEDVVGSRMVYTYTDIDIVDLYVKHIIQKLNKEEQL